MNFTETMGKGWSGIHTQIDGFTRSPGKVILLCICITILLYPCRIVYYVYV
jgi:hypothetical protein